MLRFRVALSKAAFDCHCDDETLWTYRGPSKPLQRKGQERDGWSGGLGISLERRQKTVFGSQGLQAGRQAGSWECRERARGDVGLGDKVTAGRVERLERILSGPQISLQEGVSRG